MPLGFDQDSKGYLVGLHGCCQHHLLHFYSFVYIIIADSNVHDAVVEHTVYFQLE